MLAVEQPSIRVYALDPGDMRTEMHQLAYPGEDISDRPEPENVVPAVLQLLDSNRPSGRYRAHDLLISKRTRRLSTPSRRVRPGEARCQGAHHLRAARGSLLAVQPPEARGLRRDQVRLPGRRRATVTSGTGGSPTLPVTWLPGDLVVVNTSATLAGRRGRRTTGGGGRSSYISRPPLARHHWVVEVRPGAMHAHGPVTSLVQPGDRVGLTGDASATLVCAAYPQPQRTRHPAYGFDGRPSQ